MKLFTAVIFAISNFQRLVDTQLNSVEGNSSFKKILLEYSCFTMLC